MRKGNQHHPDIKILFRQSCPSSEFLNLNSSCFFPFTSKQVHSCSSSSKICLICLQIKMSQDNSLLLGGECQGEAWPFIIPKRWGTKISGGKVFIMWYCSITMTLYFCSARWWMHAGCNHSAPAAVSEVHSGVNSCIHITGAMCWPLPAWDQHSPQCQGMKPGSVQYQTAQTCWVIHHTAKQHS